MSYNSIEKAESVVNRIPQEIWWDIFDSIIDVPMYFTTTYVGDDWTRDANQFMNDNGSVAYFTLERQRKIIGSICRSWQIWANSRSNRSVKVTTT
jgi:hypothetical protein